MPTVAEVLQQGWQVHQAGNVDAAMQLYRGVLHQVPTSADAWVYLGIAQFDQRDFDGSVDSYRRAIQIREHFPIAWNNLGNSLRMLGRTDEAETSFETALNQQPNYLSALKNRGTLWVWNGQIERGLEWYAKGLEVDPSNAELHRNLGVISLLLGDYQRGFDEYRWRWKMPGVSRPQVATMLQAAGHHIPVWSGEPLDGKTVLIYPEQGLGDAIHFIRVASALKASGAYVIVVCSPRMIPLFSTAPGIDQLVPDLEAGASLSDVSQQPDFQGSFLEILDGLYQRDHQIYFGEDLYAPAGTGGTPQGYLHVPETSVHFWQHWLRNARGDSASRPLVGINWQGNREHHADVYRSVALEVFRPIVQQDQWDIVCLQFGHGIEQLDQSDFASKVLRLPDTLDQSTGQFMDTSAVLCNLDALVTTDTAIAHLAGSLGVRTHLMLGRVPDWRWLMQGDTTKWYPNTQISRQGELGCWNDCVGRIVDRLGNSLTSDSAST